MYLDKLKELYKELEKKYYDIKKLNKN